LGGGGYTIKNVARCWAYETGICLGQELDNSIPMNDFYEFYGGDYKLHFNVSVVSNDTFDNKLSLSRLKTMNRISIPRSIWTSCKLSVSRTSKL
jgi:histone deacetylase 1/2